MVAAASVLVAGGCGDDTTMPPPVQDMAVAFDLHKLNCGQLLSCGMPCTTVECVTACVMNATPTAVQLATAFSTCVYGQCGVVDGGSGACTSPYDPSPACRVCQFNALSGPCKPEYDACQANM
jgi:hypothetical protein